VNLDEIVKQGALSYFKDREVYRNPYRRGSPEYDSYERGWMQSLKKDERRPVHKKLSPDRKR
jgi:hypothetical protein